MKSVLKHVAKVCGRLSHYTFTDDHDHATVLGANHDNDDNCGNAGVFGSCGDDGCRHGHVHEMLMFGSVGGKAGKLMENGNFAKMLRRATSSEMVYFRTKMLCNLLWSVVSRFGVKIWYEIVV